MNVPDDLLALVGGEKLIAQALVRRGLHDVERARGFLSIDAYVPANAYDLSDMAVGVARLQRAIETGEVILVWGDFDVDGQTSTALLVEGLRELGGKASYYIPQRKGEGHGIHIERLRDLLDGVGVLLTCDTGISAHEAIDYAQGRGVDVVVTDHHALPKVLPKAHALINPMRLPEGHALRELPGVGVAYKVIEALYEAVGQSCEHLLDLVALGIVADVMVLVDDTRYLLQKGMRVLQEGRRPALRALMAQAKVSHEHLTESDIAFALAPRLNAVGRLEDANPIVDYLTTHDTATIETWTRHLEGLNQARRGYTRQIYQGALAQIEADASLLKYASLVVVGEGWETGIVGIVASRLAETYGLPTFVLSREGDDIHGSARSVAGVDIISAIETQSHLLTGYGGHTMAAGIRLRAENLLDFRRGISQAVRAIRQDVPSMSTLRIDGYVDFRDVTMDFVHNIRRLAPFGNGNPSLVVATRNVRLKSTRRLTRDGEHIAVTLVDGRGDTLRLMWWHGDATQIPAGGFDIAYEVRVGAYQGQVEVVAEWLGWRVNTPESERERTAKREVIDARREGNALNLLRDYQAQYPEHLVYVEGIGGEVAGVTRYDVTPTETLIVWSVPPTVQVWQGLLEASQAERLILFGAVRPISEPRTLLEMVVGMGKYALAQREGIITLEALCHRTGQSEAVVEACLAWLSARGSMRFDVLRTGVYRVISGGVEDGEQAETMKAHLSTLLDEVRAYETYWLQHLSANE